MVSRRLRSTRSSGGAAGSIIFSIVFAASSFARSERAARNLSLGAAFVFTVSPSSTSRRMASERLSVCASPQASTCLVRSAGRRTALTGSTPPAFFGRPRVFLFTEIDFFIFFVYRKNKPEGSANFRPGSNPNHEDRPMAQADSVHSTPPQTGLQTTSIRLAEASSPRPLASLPLPPSSRRRLR